MSSCVHAAAGTRRTIMLFIYIDKLCAQIYQFFTNSPAIKTIKQTLKQWRMQQNIRGCWDPYSSSISWFFFFPWFPPFWANSSSAIKICIASLNAIKFCNIPLVPWNQNFILWMPILLACCYVGVIWLVKRPVCPLVGYFCRKQLYMEFYAQDK